MCPDRSVTHAPGCTNRHLSLAALLLGGPIAAQTEFCGDSAPTTYLLTGTYLGPNWVNFSGTLHIISHSPGECPSDPCEWEIEINWTIRSANLSASPILELCIFYSSINPVACSAFPIPGSTQPDGTFLQQLHYDLEAGVPCGNYIRYLVNWRVPYGLIPAMDILLVCGGC